MKDNVAEFLEFRYEKLKLLKRSERGEVWLASTRLGGDLVTIKRVAATGLPYDVIRQAAFALPAKVFFCAEDAAETVVVEEFIQGENLLERLERKNFLREAEARAILLQMCDGLRELHAQKIIHRDIKPSNMILQGDKIRLIDFDAARIFKDGQDSDTRLLGTKGYAPPEQFGSGQTDPRSDIYSLGVTLKELLGSNGGERLKKILDKCTELDPKHRFQSVDELKSALTAAEPRSPVKFRAALIVVAAAGILFANTPTLHRAEHSAAEEIVLQAEALPVEKFSPPAQVVKSEFPTLVAPPVEQSPLELPKAPSTLNLPPVKKFSLSADSSELPKVVAPPQKFSGLLKIEFYFNGAPFDQSKYLHENVKITRAEWKTTQVRLHVINDTGGIWQNPTIRFILSQTMNDEIKETKTLPALNVGASADFTIPFNLLTLSDRGSSAAYIQIWLEGDEAKMDEHYWCVWFDIVD